MAPEGCLKMTKISYSIPWPAKVDIRFGQGIILTISLFSIFQALPIIFNSTLLHILAFFEKQRIIEYEFGRQLNMGIQLIILYSFRLIIVYLIVQLIMKIHIRTLLFHTIPSIKQGLHWTFIGICLSWHSAYTAWTDNYEREEPLPYVLLGTLVIVIANIIGPIQEEVTHRGILFSALRKKGKLLAYFISTFWFVLGHMPSYSGLILFGYIGLSPYHLSLLILMAIVTAYIYETTGNLILCIICHSMCNLTPEVIALLNYVIN